jgi:biotin operon repressor
MSQHPSTDTGISQCDKILASLHLHSGRWVSVVHLASISGSMAVHSRISDLRARGINIEHRNERVGRMIHSSYRLFTTHQQPELF